MQTLFFKKKHVCASLGAVGKDNRGRRNLFDFIFFFVVFLHGEVKGNERRRRKKKERCVCVLKRV